MGEILEGNIEGGNIMKQDVDILILIEHINRELDTALLLKILLSTKGYSVQIASIPFDMWETVATVRPRFLIVPWGNLSLSKFRRYSLQEREGLRILNLHQEQVAVESYLESVKAPRGESQDTFHLVWGERFEKILLARGVPKELILRTGNPRLDLLRPEMASFNPDRQSLASSYDLDPDRRWILVAGNFSLVSASKGSIRKMVSRGRKDFPSRVERVRSLYTKTLGWMERLAGEMSDLEIIYRPHPSELITPALKEICTRTPRIKVIQERPLGDWILQSDSVFVWSSTSSVDALVADKPVFAIRHEDDGASAFPDTYFPILDDLPKVNDYETFRSSATCNDKPSTHPRWESAFLKFREFYDIPPEPAFLRLGRTISEIMGKGEGVRFQQVPIHSALRSLYRLQHAGKRGLHNLGIIRSVRRYEREADDRLVQRSLVERETFLTEKLKGTPWLAGREGSL